MDLPTHGTVNRTLINDTTSALRCQIFFQKKYLQKIVSCDIIYALQLNKRTVQVPNSGE